MLRTYARTCDQPSPYRSLTLGFLRKKKVKLVLTANNSSKCCPKAGSLAFWSVSSTPRKPEDEPAKVSTQSKGNFGTEGS
jgi:hypothetical protein